MKQIEPNIGNIRQQKRKEVKGSGEGKWWNEVMKKSGEGKWWRELVKGSAKGKWWKEVVKGIDEGELREVKRNVGKWRKNNGGEEKWMNILE